MKKLIAIVLVGILAVGLVFLTGCGGNEMLDDVTDAFTTQETTAQGTTAENGIFGEDESMTGNVEDTTDESNTSQESEASTGEDESIAAAQ